MQPANCGLVRHWKEIRDSWTLSTNNPASESAAAFSCHRATCPVRLLWNEIIVAAEEMKQVEQKNLFMQFNVAKLWICLLVICLLIRLIKLNTPPPPQIWLYRGGNWPKVLFSSSCTYLLSSWDNLFFISQRIKYRSLFTFLFFYKSLKCFCRKPVLGAAGYVSLP